MSEAVTTWYSASFWVESLAQLSLIPIYFRTWLHHKVSRQANYFSFTAKVCSRSYSSHLQWHKIRCNTMNLTCRGESCSSVLVFESSCVFVFETLKGRRDGDKDRHKTSETNSVPPKVKSNIEFWSVSMWIECNCFIVCVVCLFLNKSAHLIQIPKISVITHTVGKLHSSSRIGLN